MATERKRDHHAARKAKTKRTLGAIARGVNPNQYAQTNFAKNLLRGRWDIAFFAEEFLGIKLHPGQLRVAEAYIKRDGSGWAARWLTICISAGNRAGKTLIISIIMLHSTIYKHGMEPPNPLDPAAIKRWNEAAYEWYHFAIQQETAELAYIEIMRILTGTHEAQANGCPLTKALGPNVAEWSKKYRGEYLWIKVHPILGGGQIHFRTTGEKAIGSLGKDMHGISYDEAGFDPNFNFVVNEVLQMRRLSTNGQLIMIGTTTEGLTDFADKWAEGDPAAPDKKRDSYSLRMSTRDNIGYGITPKQFARMLEQMPPELWPQNIDGFFIEGASAFFSSQSVDKAFIHELPELLPAIKGHKYVQGVDPALTFDSTYSIVLDTTTPGSAHGVRIDRKVGRTTGPIIAALTTDAHRAYQIEGTYVETAIDATGFGGKMFRDLLYIQPLRSVEFGGTKAKKLKLLNDLKWALETGLLKFPRSGKWLDLRRQLLGYKLDDKGLKTDAVMALAVAVSTMRLNPAGATRSAPFDFFGTGGKLPVVSSLPSGPRITNASYASLSDMARRERK